jgi:asparagine synthase (glutamine-hydrolysing)
VLRSDKSISSHGLEPRTPYLDKSFVNAYLGLSIEERFTPGNIEKNTIRKIIEIFDPLLLPREILFRRKEAFSDGVSGLTTPWYKTIQERVPRLPSKDGLTPEQQYYLTLFQKYHKQCDLLVPYYWMPRFVEATDASARTLSMYHSAEV